MTFFNGENISALVPSQLWNDAVSTSGDLPLTDPVGTMRYVLDEGAIYAFDGVIWSLIAAPGLSGGLTYRGLWDADTNTPTLGASPETALQGWFYIVSVAGNTDLDGENVWNIGDWAIYNGTSWNKIDYSNVDFFGGVTITTIDNANNPTLTLTNNDTTNNPITLVIDNQSSGLDISAGNWSITQSGNITAGNLILDNSKSTISMYNNNSTWFLSGDWNTGNNNNSFYIARDTVDNNPNLYFDEENLAFGNITIAGDDSISSSSVLINLNDDSTTFSSGVTITVPDEKNLYGMVITQNDVTNNPAGLGIINNGNGASIEINSLGGGYDISSASWSVTSAGLITGTALDITGTSPNVKLTNTGATSKASWITFTDTLEFYSDWNSSGATNLTLYDYTNNTQPFFYDGTLQDIHLGNVVIAGDDSVTSSDIKYETVAKYLTITGGQSLTVANTINKDALAINQNDTTNNKKALVITNTGTGRDLEINSVSPKIVIKNTSTGSSNLKFINPSNVEIAWLETDYNADGNKNFYIYAGGRDQFHSEQGGKLGIGSVSFGAGNTITSANIVCNTDGTTIIKNLVEKLVTVTDAESPYTALVTDTFIMCDGSQVSPNAAISVILPSAQAAVDGKKYIIKDIGGIAATSNITISTQGAEKIDGEDTYVLDNDYESVQIIAANGNWWIY